MAQTLQLLIKFIESVESRRAGIGRSGEISGKIPPRWELQPLLQTDSRSIESFDICNLARCEVPPRC